MEASATAVVTISLLAAAILAAVVVYFLNRYRLQARRDQAAWAAQSAALEARCQALEQDLVARAESRARLDDKLVRFRKANAAFKRSLEVRDAELRAEQDQSQALRRDLVVMRRHTVFLDGMPRAGKTTFIERLTNPLADRAQLLNQTATQYPYQTDPIPLCWENVEGVRVLHTLEFYDIGGEHPQHVIDNILNYRERSLKEQGRALALVLWDAAAGHPNNVGYLNTGRMGAVYGPRVARDVISAIVVFFNKCDVVERQLGEGGETETLEQILDLQRRILLADVFEKALHGYPDPVFASGSAITGEGVHYCLGKIVEALGLNHNFQRPGGEQVVGAGTAGGQ